MLRKGYCNLVYLFHGWNKLFQLLQETRGERNLNFNADIVDKQTPSFYVSFKM